jgi:hypothetical protein
MGVVTIIHASTTQKHRRTEHAKPRITHIEFSDKKETWEDNIDYSLELNGRQMMMSFICSCRNKNQPKVIYPKGTSHHMRLFRGPITNDMKK